MFPSGGTALGNVLRKSGKDTRPMEASWEHFRTEYSLSGMLTDNSMIESRVLFGALLSILLSSTHSFPALEQEAGPICSPFNARAGDVIETKDFSAMDSQPLPP